MRDSCSNNTQATFNAAKQQNKINDSKGEQALLGNAFICKQTGNNKNNRSEKQ